MGFELWAVSFELLTAHRSPLTAPALTAHRSCAHRSRSKLPASRSPLSAPPSRLLADTTCALASHKATHHVLMILLILLLAHRPRSIDSYHSTQQLCLM